MSEICEHVLHSKNQSIVVLHTDETERFLLSVGPGATTVDTVTGKMRYVAAFVFYWKA